MQIKSILAAAAIALAASLGSAYAADQFATLDGVTAQPMNTLELDQVRGAGGFEVTIPGIVPSPFPGVAFALAAEHAPNVHVGI